MLRLKKATILSASSAVDASDVETSDDRFGDGECNVPNSGVRDDCRDRADGKSDEDDERKNDADLLVCFEESEQTGKEHNRVEHQRPDRVELNACEISDQVKKRGDARCESEDYENDADYDSENVS